MDKLVALPVSGDSYLLQRGDKNILVDGGYSSGKLAKALSSKEVDVDHLDIVVCTHADRDHAGGLADLLEKTHIQVDEFWLPGAWLDSLPTLLRNPGEVVSALISELDRLSQKPPFDSVGDDFESFESQVHKYVSGMRREYERYRPEDSSQNDSQAESNGLSWIKQHLIEDGPDVRNGLKNSSTFERARRQIRYRTARGRLNTVQQTFWLSLINTVELIRRIAIQAIHHNVCVRWFDFGMFLKNGCPSGGVSGVLTPLNAVELTSPPLPITGQPNYLFLLTPVNEECLVFLSPSKFSLPLDLGVIFTGDSPLGCGPNYQLTWLSRATESMQWLVATAPHHGSESNKTAYSHLDHWAQVVLWIRSGGSSKHPGETFRRLPSQKRACTDCRRKNLHRDILEVQLSCGPPFIFRVKAHDCVC